MWTNSKIKWGYATSRIPNLPRQWGDAGGRIRLDSLAPQRNDVLLSEVVSLGRHKRIDLHNRCKSKLFVGDVVGLVLSPRYATRQFEAVVPPTLDELHFVCAGGVCGRVIGVPDMMTPPTLLRPLGYLLDDQGERVNLKRHALETVDHDNDADVIVVVGSSMDSGKTTAAFSLLNGLSHSGHAVAAAKITGTASCKDLSALIDAGATRALDFTDAGFGSTADLSAHELWEIANTLISHLADENPDTIVIEIADGLLQRETAALLGMIADMPQFRGALFTCTDSLHVAPGIARLQSYGLNVLAVSGLVTASHLSIREAEQETSVPVLSSEDLKSPSVAVRIGLMSPDSQSLNTPFNHVLAQSPRFNAAVHTNGSA